MQFYDLRSSGSGGCTLSAAEARGGSRTNVGLLNMMRNKDTIMVSIYICTSKTKETVRKKVQRRWRGYNDYNYLLLSGICSSRRRTLLPRTFGIEREVQFRPQLIRLNPHLNARRVSGGGGGIRSDGQEAHERRGVEGRSKLMLLQERVGNKPIYLLSVTRSVDTGTGASNKLPPLLDLPDCLTEFPQTTQVVV